MNKTDIEWVKNPDGTQGYTWNPITGCLNHDNGLCKGGGFPCYAYKLAHGRLKQRYLANSNWVHWDPPENGYYDPFYPRFWENRLREGVFELGRKPKGIFVCDMGDLFGIGIPEDWTKKKLACCKVSPQHRFYLLTKQPQNLPQFSPFPDNCWVGVTATNRDMFTWACDYLADVKAKVKYISFEPLLTPIILDAELDMGNIHRSIDWLIIGACTGTYREIFQLHHRLNGDTPARQIMPFGNKCSYQPKIEWVREIVEAADKAGVKVFLKDNLEPLFKRGDIWAIPEWASFNDWTKQDIGTTLRQEMPEKVTAQFASFEK